MQADRQLHVLPVVGEAWLQETKAGRAWLLRRLKNHSLPLGYPTSWCQASPGFQFHQRFSTSSSKPARRSGKWGNRGFTGFIFSIFYILPGGEVAISDVDMDSFPGAYPAIPPVIQRLLMTIRKNCLSSRASPSQYLGSPRACPQGGSLFPMFLSSRSCPEPRI